MLTNYTPKNILLLGDIHGNINIYRMILDEHRDKTTICLGDFGFKKEYKFLGDPERNKLLMGNHDDYNNIPSHSLGDYGIFNDIFFVRGAFSIDWRYRVMDINWWTNEELTYLEGKGCLDLWRANPQDTVISHDCPEIIYNEFYENKRPYGISRTQVLLQMMFDIHKPKQWIFGHHHRSWNKTIDGCDFRCLNMYEVFELRN